MFAFLAAGWGLASLEYPAMEGGFGIEMHSCYTRIEVETRECTACGIESLASGGACFFHGWRDTNALDGCNGTTFWFVIVTVVA